MKKKEFSFIDLFAGIGGFRAAFDSMKHVKMNCVFSSEIDLECKKIYFDNFGDMPEGDITRIPDNSVPKHDILCAGFPCQAFSISGNRKGFKDERGSLFFEIVRIARHHQPPILFLENVANLLKIDKGKTINQVVQALDNSNYDVFYDVLNASEYGIPQSRKRLYIVCFRKDLKVRSFEFPEPTNEKILLESVLLPEYDTSHLRIDRTDIQIDEKRLNELSSGLYSKSYLQPIRVGQVNKGGQGERIYHPKGHAITLSAYGGGVGAKTGLYYINGNVRKLHPIECKKLMGFPSGFLIHSNPNVAYKQFGNAIIVRMVYLILERVLKHV